MFDKTRNELKSADYKATVNVVANIDQKKLSIDAKKKFNNKLLSLGIDRPQVLGIDNSEELAILTPPTIPNVNPIAENNDIDVTSNSKAVDSRQFESLPQKELKSSLHDEEPSLFDFGKNKMKVKLNYSVNGKFDSNDKKNPKGESNLEMEVDMSGIIVRFDFETKIIDNNIYFKIGQLPPPFSMMVDADFLGKWWSLNLEELAAQQQQKDSFLKEGLPSNLNFNFKLDEEKTKALEAKIENIVKKYKIFKVDKVLAEETIEGHPCYHYKLKIDRDIIHSAVLEIFGLIDTEMDELLNTTADSNQENKAKLAKITETRNKIDKELKGQSEDLLDQVVKIIDNYEIIVWIDKDTSFLRKTKFDFNLNLKNLKLDKLDDEIKNAIEVELSGEIQYSNLNKEVEIVAPIEAESIMSFLNKSITGAKMKSRNIRRISDVKQMQTALELYYNDNGQYPDSLGDLSSGKRPYIPILPENPKPSDGDCSVDYNYKYQVNKDKGNYKLYYCLGADTGRIPAGENIADNSEMFQVESKIIAPVPLINSKTDSDLDGLFDQDEIDIYKTDPNNSDTDGDGYLDGDEVKNGYNPAGAGSLFMALYGDNWKGYHTPEFSIQYPEKWTLDNRIEKLSDEQRAISGIKLQILSPYDTDKDVLRENVILSIIDLTSTNYKTVDDWYNNSKVDAGIVKKISTTKMTMLGYPAIEEVYLEKAGEDSSVETVQVRKRYFVKGNKLYQLKFYAEKKESKVVDHQIEAIKIMDSFKLKL